MEMMIRSILSSASVLALSCFAANLAQGATPIASDASATLELVQSVPLETTLAVPGVRQAQEVWIEMIRAATTTLDLEQFYVSDQAGQALEPVIQEIQAAAARGVRVRLLVDKKMDATYPDSIVQIGSFSRAESRLIDFSSLGGVQHAKFFVVDGKQSFVGSQNFDWRALAHIHEIGLRVADAGIAATLSQIFERDWAAGSRVAGGTSAPVAPRWIAWSSPLLPSFDVADLGVSVVASPEQVNPAGIPDSLSAIVSLMKQARHSIAIQVMEYTTSVYGESGTHWRALDDAIRAAASAGVHVQLCVDVSDVKKAKADLRALAALANVEVKAVTIPAWSGGAIDYARLIHSKYVVIDGGTTGWVGSENWSEGYFTNTRDVGLMVSDPGIASQLNQVFARVWSSTYAAKVAP
jgi:phosphatidylserine/phosphatidylglycerophosphate/cardiolipin synthase-like enzyme